MATLKTLGGLSPSRPLSHTVCVVLLAFLGVFAQGQGPGTTNNKITMSVLEEKPAGVVVGMIPIRDGYTYNFETESSLFELDRDGVIRTRVRIDREALIRERGEDSVDLFIEGTHPTEAFHPIDVTISVLDINDNAPRFTESRISVSFQEDAQAGQQQLLDTAIDPDNGINGTITEYTIVSGNDLGKFRLIPPNSESPYMFIVTQGDLDRETRDMYSLNISATDGGDNPLTGYLQLTIDVTDVNDIPPTFEYSDYVTQVNESAGVGTSVIRVEAADGDLGDNGEVFYILTDSSGQFTIDERTGVIRTLTSPLQCYRQCGGAPASDCNPYSCLMTVLARDGGQTPQEGRARITVAIIDENDHDPIITFYPQNVDPVTGYATIDENAQGLRVASISVRDADHGVNGETSVQIIAGNEAGHFNHVYLSTGTVNINYISVKDSLDRENIAMYNLTFKAVDHGTPPRSSTAYLIIVVNDANDHAPVFEKAEYRTELSELAMPGSSVASVKAVDGDSGPNSQLTYTIVSGNNQSWFAIDAATGLVTTRVALDHETTQRVTLNISARDSGTTPFTNYTRLVVDILDENDMAPRFEEDEVRVEVSENQGTDAELTTFTAVDYDSGINGTVTYQLHPDTQLLYPDTFQVGAASGRVSTRRSLDREMRSYYLVKVIAKDGGRPSLSSTATVHLSVTDQNDNVPVFQPKVYYVNVFETDPAGIPVVQVSAVDADAGLYGRVTYGFTGSVFGDFHIDQYTGIISTTTQLRRTVRSTYQLSVLARDAGGRTSQEPATVNVIVGNPNDAAPVFPSQPVTFEITEDNGDEALNLGQTVGQVQATGGGSSIRYGITDGDPLQVFSIDSSGVIRREKLVDHEVSSEYILTVIAHTGSRFGEKRVTINVKDLNDNAPRFLATSTETVVMEDWPVGDNIFLAGAVDDDWGDNARLTYTLHSVQDVSGVFGIDPQTGIISLEKPTTQLRGNSQVTLTVTVQDAGTPPQSNSMNVVVKIQDVNDHTPVFPMNVYRFHLLESRPVNQVFMKFVATDADEGRNGELVYSILRGNEEGRFGIFPDGQLFVAHELDRETRDMYSLTVKVRDCGDARRSSSANVTIYILDANDNSPVFNNASYIFTVAENRPATTLVGNVKATDSDIGQNAEVVYSLTEGNANFSINPITGEIFTRRPFDREYIMDTSSVEFYTFDVFATDGGNPRLRGKATVRVYVSDVNDNPPMFARPLFNAAVAENAAIDTKVIKMTATDIDTGANAAISYVIIKGNEAGKFKIATATGEITVNGTLDRETVDHYLLTVEATDTGSGTRLSSSAQVSITVMDHNDNVPAFTSSFQELRVEETRPIGEVLTVFWGTDADLGNNAKIFFSIFSGNEDGVFNLDGYTGKLYLVRQLDYETRRQYTLNVSVTDAGYHPTLSSHAFLNIRVIDVNDNSPVFKDGFSSINVLENTGRNQPVATLRAEDKDSGDFGVIQFAIISQDPNENAFSINPNTGEIFVSGALDRERTEYYKLTITATDQASPASLRHTAQRTLRIRIGDVNDNAPVFRSPPAYVVPADARSGQIIAEVYADDADSGENGVVSYSLVSQTSLFSIGSSNGQISLLQNMPSNQVSHRLRILAIDNGYSGQNDRLTAETYVTIILFNNNNGPVFFGNPYSGSLSESAVADTSIFRVSASATRPEVQVEYYLTGITSGGVQRGAIFQVDPSSGVVTNAEQLDRETLGGTFTLEITAMEKASTPATRTIEATVTLQDVNDTPPRFSPSVYNVNFPENAQQDPSVVRVLVNDPDTTGQLSLSIHGEGSSNFDIQDDGTIVAITNLDRESQDLYRLSITASDSLQTSTASVTITIIDDNDHSPVFNQSFYSFRVHEDADIGATVARVTALDDDVGENAHVTYQMMSEWGRDLFQLDSILGTFTLIGSLDYETRQLYTLKISASDSGSPPRSSTVDVYMNVVDVNDNQPVFDPASYSHQMPEDVPIGHTVLNISATDVDSGQNGDVRYSLVGDSNLLFTVDPVTGTIQTAAPLDRETQATYTLDVMATDQAENEEDRLSTTAEVTVILLDVNDCPPEFTSPNVTYVKEETPNGTVVFTVTATDLDAGVNSDVTFTLAPVPILGYPFILDRDTGHLRVNSVLRRERIANYTLSITAKDGGSPSLSTTQQLVVHIEDVNNNAPTFTQAVYRQTVLEDVSVGTSLLRVSATDEDEGLNGVVRYFIFSGDDSYDFALDMASGVLRLQKNLDHERVQEYTLTVRAEDSGVEKTLTGEATVIITVGDVNDFQPVFDDSPYIAYVQEGMTDVPVEVTTVTARDEDSDQDDNNKVAYQLRDVGNQIQGVFSINELSGQIMALSALDREVTPMYTLTVIATDTGLPRLTGTGTLTVFVKDVNDHAPTFDSSAPFIGHVTENGGSSQSVITVTATDLDEGVNAQITYRLADSQGDRFTVLTSTGEILTTQPLDREETAEYHLVVIATDQGIPPKSSSCSVVIYVDDENDNTPAFEMASYSQSIVDPTNPGDFVIGVTAVDKDSGNNGKVKYSLTGSNLFHISTETGVVTAAQRLSGSGTYTFQVRASDLGLQPKTSTVNVTVQLQSVDGSPPTFGEFPPNVRIPENSRKGTVLLTVSAVTSRSARLTYHIVGGNVNSALAINEDNGTITVAGLIDYEVSSSLTLWLMAKDRATVPLSAYKALTITVLDENDNIPRFTSPLYETNLTENKPLGTSVIQVKATDEDSGQNGQVEYRIVSGNDNNTFQIHPSSGNITTHNPVVDREGIELYNLVVEAIDLGTPHRLTATTTVRITILDLNDNPPVFSGLFSMAVPEDLPLHSLILTLTSTDKDTPANANATYHLISGAESFPFAVDPISGNITNIHVLDAETKERYRPSVRVSDSSFHAQTQVTIRLLDVNDNAPQFSSTAFVFDLREGQPEGTPVGTLAASDLDISQPNNEFYFSLKRPSLLFELDAETGEIRARTTMEYQHTADGPSSSNIHTLDVVVTDLGMPSLSSEATVTISITDANNHAPVFELSEYMSAVPKNAGPGVSILTVQAHDFLDFGVNAQVRYSVTGGNGSSLFGVEAETGVVSVTGVLSPTQIGQDYVITVTATDQGQPPQSSSARVVLSITQINSYAPVFRNPIMSKNLSEDVPVGTIIDTISASDRDQGLNKEVRFSISGGNDDDLFKIDPVNGYLTVNGPLDYEKEQRHVLDITARDMGLLSLSVTKPYTITLVDVNDNSPVFSKSLYNAFVPENSRAGSIVTTITATDADTGNNAVIKYNVIGDVAAESKFAIHEDSGTVTVKGALDYETRSVYTLGIMAYNPAGDSTIMKTYTEIRIYVTGVNEFYPRFVRREYSLSVSESASMNTTLLSIHATDDDMGVDGVVYYYLVGSSNLKGFALDPLSGALRVVERPDYESSPQIILTALAKNWGAIHGNDTDTCTITITVQDANDPPVFTQEIYMANVLEGSRAATSVITVTATDNDIREENRNFHYAIEDGNDGSWFRIDANTGRIETTGLGILDRETVPEYVLQVLAVDTGIPPQTGTCVVRVFLDDVNDNGPAFDPSKLIAHVIEGLPPGREVIRLSANTTDPDAHPNQGPFAYEPVPGDPAMNYFAITRDRGIVTTKAALSREETPEFHIPVIVYDNGQPTMSSTLTFTVIVSDINNNAPMPRPLTVRVTVLEGMSSVGVIADVRPLDEDLEGNYSCRILSGGAGVFNISQGCQLRMLRDTQQDSHLLMVNGSDGGSFPEVTYPVRVELQRYTKQQLNNSVAVLLEDISTASFLADKYVAFRLAVEGLLGLSSSALLFSVKAEGSDLFVFLSVKDERGIVIPQAMLAQKLTESKTILGSRAGVRVKDAAFQLCDVNPCQHNGNCTTKIQMSEAGLLSNESPLLILTSALPSLNETCDCTPQYGGDRCELAMQPCGGSYCANGGTCVNDKCSCPAEYTGTYCENDVDECVTQQPCQSGGTCINTPGSFQCTCPEQFYGRLCENEYQCVSRPCLNGATCIEDLEDSEGGYRCECAYGFFGDNCEKASLGFSEGSYLTVSPITEYGEIRLIGHFATRSTNALLLFNPLTINSVDSGYVALEVVNGVVRFSFKLGSSSEESGMVETGVDVTSGHWYRFEAKKLEQVASLVTQRCSDDGRTCELCQNSTCYREVPASPLSGAIQGGILSVGGVEDLTPILQLSGAIRSHDFIGCMHSFRVNSRDVLDLANAINYTRLSNMCPRRQAASLCKADTCSSGGVCEDRWSEPACLCSESTTGNRCEMKWQPFGFGANSKVTFTTRESYRRDQLLQESLGTARRRRQAPGSTLMLRVRTTEVSGVLYHASTDATEFLLWLEEGAIRVKVSPSPQLPITMVTNIADAEWHNVTLTSVGTNVTLNVNGHGNLTRWRDFGRAFDFGSLEVNTMAVGGARALPDGQTMKGFAGCISEFRINGGKLPLNGSSERYQITSTGAVVTGCDALCVDNTCKSGEVCTPDGETYNCSTDTAPAGPVAASSGLEPGIIVIIVFFIIVIIIIVAVFIVFRVRRDLFNRCLPAKGENAARKQAGGGSKLVGSQNSLHSSRDSRYADNSQLEEMIIRNHIAEELAGQKTSSLTARPDLIGSNLSGVPQPTQFPDGTMIIENIDQNGVSSMPGLSGDDMPEHYDLENASSIAPSEADVIQHYQRYRHANEIKAHLNNHHHHHHQVPGGRLHGTPAARLGFREGAHQRQSPVSVTGSALSMPARNSPLAVPGQSGRPSSALAALGHQYGPRDSPRIRASPLAQSHNANTSQGSRSNSAHSLGSHHSHSSSSSNPHLPNGHGPQRGVKGGKGSQGRYQRGLTVDEVNRLNARADLKNTASMLEAVSSSSEDPHHHHHHLHPAHARSPHLHNAHLQRLRADETVENNVLLEPPDSSSSDSGANDSFTCSEFEYDNDRTGRLDPGTMIFSKLTEVDEDDLPPARNGDSRNSNGDSAGSTAASDDAQAATGSGEGAGPSGPFDDFEALLNLGPTFDKFVGVFKDIALLPDSNQAALEGATSNDYEEYV